MDKRKVLIIVLALFFLSGGTVDYLMNKSRINNEVKKTDSSVIKTNSNFSKEDIGAAETVVKDFIKAYYTVTQEDYENCRSILSEKLDQKNYDSLYEQGNLKFQQILTENCYAWFIGARLGTGRVVSAFRNGYYVQVKDIQLEKYQEDAESNTIVYNCQVKLSKHLIADNSDKEQSFNERIEATKENGQWKIGRFN